MVDTAFFGLGRSLRRRTLTAAFVTIAAAGLSGCVTPTTARPTVDISEAEKEATIQRSYVLKERLDNFNRAYSVAWPIFKENAEICPKTTVEAGYWTGLITDFPENYRAAARMVYGGPMASLTVVRTAGEASKVLQKGDILVSVDGQPVPTGKAGREAFKDYSFPTDRDSIPVVRSRDGVREEVQVPLTKICNYPIRFDDSAQGGDTVNAYADGKSIALTKGMMRFANTDQELALVIGHELAHNTRRHREAKTANQVGGMVIGAIFTVLTGVNVMDAAGQIGAGAYSQEFEAEADYVGVYHAERAGFDMSGAEEFWRRMAANSPGAINLGGTTHPSSAKRFVAIAEAVQEVKRKKANGESLIPEEAEAAVNAEPPKDRPSDND